MSVVYPDQQQPLGTYRNTNSEAPSQNDCSRNSGVLILGPPAASDAHESLRTGQGGEQVCMGSKPSSMTLGKSFRHSECQSPLLYLK